LRKLDRHREYQARTECTYKNLFFYLDISNRKQSTANINGDGPLQTTQKELEKINLTAFNRNGINIYRARMNCPFKVQKLNVLLLQTKVLNAMDCKLGYIVTNINDIDLQEYNNLLAATLLATANIFSLKMFSSSEYRILKRTSTNISEIQSESPTLHNFNQVTNELINLNMLAMNLNGLNISRRNRYSSFEVQELNFTILATRISNKLSIGDIVLEINDIILQVHDNIFTAQLLSSTILVSIRTYTPRRIENHTPEGSTIFISEQTTNFINNHTNLGTLNSAFTSNSGSNQTFVHHSDNVYNSSQSSATSHMRSNLNMQLESEITMETAIIGRNMNDYNYTSITIEWDYRNPCLYCGCVFLKSEKNRKVCCHNGDFFSINSTFPRLKPLPPQVKFLCIERTPHFSRNCVSYNNILALGATGVDNGTDNSGWEFRFEDSCITLHGRTYHFLSNSAGKGGFQYFLYDAQAAMINHGNELNQYSGRQDSLRIYINFLQLLYAELKVINVLVNEVQKIGNEISTNQYLMGDTTNLILNLNATTSHFDVAAISSTESSGNRVLKIRRKGNQRTSDIQVTDSKLEPLSYPLLFPYGENGWGDNIRKSLKFPSYLLSRMLMGEKNLDGTFLQVRNRKGILVTVNRFQLMSRLGQTYLVDNVSRAIDFRLAWHRSHQEDVFGLTPNSSVESTQESNGDENDHMNNEQTFLGQSFHGSRRHLRSLSANALSIISEYGRPSIFITLTCNAYWDDITEMLLESQVLIDKLFFCNTTTYIFLIDSI